MPLFIDRHDVSPSVTAKQVAYLHQADLKIQHLYHCRALTYWFDENRNTAFCLVEAPDETAVLEMHLHAHGKVPNKIIEVKAELVESFLGRIENPGNLRDQELKIITEPAFRIIMVIRINEINIKNFDNLNDFISTRTKMDNKIQEILKVCVGRIVKMQTGYYLLSFSNALDSLNTALKIYLMAQNQVSEQIPNRHRLHIGISAGSPVTSQGSFFEQSIQLANWLADIKSDKTMISLEVKRLVIMENLNQISQYNQFSEMLLNSFYYLKPDEESFYFRLMSYLDEAYKNAQLSINDFTRALGTSRSMLYRKILHLTGKSPTFFLAEFRLQKAMELLQQTNLNISEVAYETGFTSPAYFSRCFHKCYGISPTEIIHTKRPEYPQ